MRRLAVLVLLAAGCRIDLQDKQTYQQMTTDGAPCTKGSSGLCQCTVQTNQACMDAVGHSDFTYINDNILNHNCQGSACHQTDSSSAAKMNPYAEAAVSYASLVDFDSQVTHGVKLVVKGQPKMSYLLVMVNKLPIEDFLPAGTAYPDKSDPGFMPQGNSTLCCQKLDAIEAWITAGAAM